MVQDASAHLIAVLPRLRRFAVGLTGSEDEADDLVQAACERALARLHQWQQGTRFDSWMFRIVQTIWIDNLRRKKVRGQQIEIDSLRDLEGDDGRRTADAKLTLDTVRRAITKLPEEQRSALLLVSVEGMSYREAAETLNIPIGTLMSRLARSRRRLYELVYRPASTRTGTHD